MLQRDAIRGREDTFMTSKGCVTNVATAPAAAAERLCTTAEFTPELGGMKRSARSVNERMKGSNGSLTCFLLDFFIEDDKYPSVRSVTKSGRGESPKQL